MKNHNHLKLLSSLIILTLLFISCANKYSETEMYGKWSVSKWVVESTGELITNQMDMEFNSDRKYSIDYGPKIESGDYWISGDYLHTIGEGQTEMSVKILELNADSLVIQMNRSGDLEKVILIRN